MGSVFSFLPPFSCQPGEPMAVRLSALSVNLLRLYFVLFTLCIVSRLVWQNLATSRIYGVRAKLPMSLHGILDYLLACKLPHALRRQ